MDDDQILARGGTEKDIEEYAKQNGADFNPSIDCILDFIKIAEASWNPDNFADLIGLIKLQYPNLTPHI